MYVKEETINTIVIEKSKFITYIKPCLSEEEYKDYLKQIKKKHYDATHVCSAFIGESVKRSSDDGEPSGTAGVPMISALEKASINNTCCLVVRYFGGIKLGAGGLIRAYSSSVSEALNCACIVEDVKFNKFRLVLSYEMANKVDYILNREAINLNKDYDAEVTFTFLSNDEKLNDKIQEVTSGIRPTLLGQETIQKEVK